MVRMLRKKESGVNWKGKSIFLTSFTYSCRLLKRWFTCIYLYFWWTAMVNLLGAYTVLSYSALLVVMSTALGLYWLPRHHYAVCIANESQRRHSLYDKQHRRTTSQQWSEWLFDCRHSKNSMRRWQLFLWRRLSSARRPVRLELRHPRHYPRRLLLGLLGDSDPSRIACAEVRSEDHCRHLYVAQRFDHDLTAHWSCVRPWFRHFPSRPHWNGLCKWFLSLMTLKIWYWKDSNLSLKRYTDGA